MFIEKPRVLSDAPVVLNQPNLPWAVYVQGDSIMLRWKWEDPNFFNPTEVSTNGLHEFTFAFTLSDKGTWKEVDQEVKKESGFSVGPGGISFGGGASAFKGRTSQKSFQIGIGEKPDGSLGVVSAKYDTTAAQEYVRNWLIACGYKKAGLFG
jgi:hypothetical protein